MILYYITDRKQFSGTEGDRRVQLLRCIAAAAGAGVDYIQLREKDLCISELELVAKDAVRVVRENSEHARLLVNSRTDVALAAGADGVHLTSEEIPASVARSISSTSTQSGLRPFVVGVSCHSTAEVRAAEAHGADFVVLGPIFEKAGTKVLPLGVETLRQAVGVNPPDLRVEAGDNRVGIPVLALGGVNALNARSCLQAGAAGIAGIRLFQDGDVRKTVRELKLF